MPTAAAFLLTLRRGLRRRPADQIARADLEAAQARAYVDAIPVGSAVAHLFGTIGSAILLAQLGPKRIGVALLAACAEDEGQLGGGVAGSDPADVPRSQARTRRCPSSKIRRRASL